MSTAEGYLYYPVGMDDEPRRVKTAPPCTWKEEEGTPGVFSTDCGGMHEFTADGIEENGYNFCPYCGGRIINQSQEGE